MRRCSTTWMFAMDACIVSIGKPCKRKGNCPMQSQKSSIKGFGKTKGKGKPSSGAQALSLRTKRNKTTSRLSACSRSR